MNKVIFFLYRRRRLTDCSSSCFIFTFMVKSTNLTVKWNLLQSIKMFHVQNKMERLIPRSYRAIYAGHEIL